MGEILEIDGPPMAFFETPIGGKSTRYTYRTLHWGSKDAIDCLNHYSTVMSRIRQLLNNQPETATILWRRRPVLACVFGAKLKADRYEIHCRLATIPELSDLQWEHVTLIENKTVGELLVEGKS